MRYRILTTIALASIVSAATACGGDDKRGSADDATDDATADATDTTATDTTATDTTATDTTATDATNATDATKSDVADDATATDAIDDTPLGGDRPAKLVLPPGYTPGVARPLVILLHGYSATGEIQDLYLGLSARASAKGFITIVPDGTTDATGVHFWNASPGWCCNFEGSTVDDKGYILGLVDEAKRRFTIDPARVYLFGHSNGGFMAHILACEHADVFAAIAVLAGSLPDDPADCKPSEPVSVLQIHGTADAVILYGGFTGEYPGAEEVVKRWAGHDGCELLAGAEDDVDYDSGVLGEETVPHPFAGCADGIGLALWEMRGSGHIPTFTDAFMPTALDWLLAHPKPAAP